MQASWNQWNSTPNNYGAPSFPNTFPNVPNAPSATPFSVPPAAPVTNPAIGSQFPNVYGSQPASATQQQWQQWEQWQQQYAQWHQQYGDKVINHIGEKTWVWIVFWWLFSQFQGSVPNQGMMPNTATFPTCPPLPPSAPSAQPPPPDSMPPSDKVCVRSEMF